MPNVSGRPGPVKILWLRWSANSSGEGKVPTDAGRYAYALLVLRHESPASGSRTEEPEIEGANTRHARKAELQNSEPAARLEDTRQLRAARAGLLDVADAEGDRRGVDGGVRDRHARGVTADQEDRVISAGAADFRGRAPASPAKVHADDRARRRRLARAAIATSAVPVQRSSTLAPGGEPQRGSRARASDDRTRRSASDSACRSAGDGVEHPGDSRRVLVGSVTVYRFPRRDTDRARSRERRESCRP